MKSQRTQHIPLANLHPSIPMYMYIPLLHICPKTIQSKENSLTLSFCKTWILDSGKLFNLLLATFDSMKAICHIFYTLLPQWSCEITKNTKTMPFSIKWQTLGWQDGTICKALILQQWSCKITTTKKAKNALVSSDKLWTQLAKKGTWQKRRRVTGCGKKTPRSNK